MSQKLTVYSGYATATTFEQTLAAEAISRRISATMHGQLLVQNLTYQELNTRVHTALLQAPAVLDERNLWDLSDLADFVWDYLLVEDASAAEIGLSAQEQYASDDAAKTDTDSLQADILAVSETRRTGTNCPQADTSSIGDAQRAVTGSVAADTASLTDTQRTSTASAQNDGGERTYFAPGYALEDYNLPENTTEESRSSAVLAGASDAFASGDVAGVLVVLAAGDGSSAEDAQRTAVNSLLAASALAVEMQCASTSTVASDAAAMAEVQRASTGSSTADIHTVPEVQQVAASVPVSDTAYAADTQQISFIGGLTDASAVSELRSAQHAPTIRADMVSAADFWALQLGVVAADASANTDARTSATSVTFGDGTAQTYFASDYASGDYNLPESAVFDAYLTSATSRTEDAAGVVEVVGVSLSSNVSEPLVTADVSSATWAFPAWVDAAVPTDSIAQALTVKLADSLAYTDTSGAVIQNYAFDPAYFSGDYATTAY